ncbi:uncharacterized protein MONOS_4713 [Monocercomonoides exilis]|uniref:uncharacterized protein n=1 Tax=Monocercomonoides exilis TaxID=2049356 RepID=UPI0035598E9D|nr:hypothetical protein MONOS_4713 [Monocercomonoides exilis]|eukprot:MONOS_4713.1-p1 / transcript=MONOS_4713.1 / gene=MONOS_4713 / organism=Monocercomonoides_exilis_PA203 / gene_product=unspecified product / transcript_product=unspecified product / location=Mono_scaffold00128:87611-89789(+) / protein_length=679 / sequence_SO=supercontig / SO=protein_coding / is_pseudo=false
MLGGSWVLGYTKGAWLARHSQQGRSEGCGDGQGGKIDKGKTKTEGANSDRSVQTTAECAPQPAQAHPAGRMQEVGDGLEQKGQSSGGASQPDEPSSSSENSEISSTTTMGMADNAEGNEGKGRGGEGLLGAEAEKVCVGEVVVEVGRECRSFADVAKAVLGLSPQIRFLEKSGGAEGESEERMGEGRRESRAGRGNGMWEDVVKVRFPATGIALRLRLGLHCGGAGRGGAEGAEGLGKESSGEGGPGVVVCVLSCAVVSAPLVGLWRVPVEWYGGWRGTGWASCLGGVASAPEETEAEAEADLGKEGSKSVCCRIGSWGIGSWGRKGSVLPVLPPFYVAANSEVACVVTPEGGRRRAGGKDGRRSAWASDNGSGGRGGKRGRGGRGRRCVVIGVDSSLEVWVWSVDARSAIAKAVERERKGLAEEEEDEEEAAQGSAVLVFRASLRPCFGLEAEAQDLASAPSSEPPSDVLSRIQGKWQGLFGVGGCCAGERREGLGKGGEKRKGRYRLVDVKVVRKRKKKGGGGGRGGVVPVVVAECEGVCGGEGWRRVLRCVYSEECGAWQPFSGSRGCLWEAVAREGGSRMAHGRDGGRERRGGGGGARMAGMVKVLDGADADVARAEELEREILGLLQAGACRGGKEGEENAAVLGRVRELQTQLGQMGRASAAARAFHFGWPD